MYLKKALPGTQKEEEMIEKNHLDVDVQLLKEYNENELTKEKIKEKQTLETETNVSEPKSIEKPKIPTNDLPILKADIPTTNIITTDKTKNKTKISCVIIIIVITAIAGYFIYKKMKK